MNRNILLASVLFTTLLSACEVRSFPFVTEGDDPNNPGEKGVFLETAHPIKFPDAVESATQKKMEIPDALLHMMKAAKTSVKIKPSFDSLKEFLINQSAID